MPELPEVQTVVISLKKLKNKEIINFNYSWKKVTYNYSPENLKKIIKYNIIKNVSRIGKYIIFHLDNKYLICHLRMTGYLYIAKSIPANNKHIRCYFNLSSNELLIYEDIRKFGGFYLFNSLAELKQKIGIDPFSKKFTANWLKNNLLKKNGMIKHLLLNQRFICGLGNIYTDEILWKTGIHPKHIAKNIKNTNLLYQNIISTLNESIKFHGTTIMNFKFDNMKTGNYKTKLEVYGRQNLLCKRCQKKIIKIKVAGRGTYVCINCQK